MPIHKPELPFGHPGRNFDDTPEHFDHRDDRYEPPPVDPPEEGIVHYGPGDRPLCGTKSPFASYTFEPDQVAGCPDCLELAAENLDEDNEYRGRCLHCRQEITAQGGGGVAPDGPEALPALWEGRMVMGWTAHDQRATH